jgi:hypothetical protein
VNVVRLQAERSIGPRVDGDPVCPSIDTQLPAE